MSTANWFRTHRKQVAIHSCIIAAFLVFTLFASEPLFDRLEAIPGEAQLHWISLPTETDDIRYSVDVVLTEDVRVVEVAGWAFIEGEDSEDIETYIVLTSDRRTYVFDTHGEARPDVTAHFEELGLNLDCSGFMTVIPARKIPSGEYAIGIYIRRGEIEALQYTGRTVVVGPGG